jgi:putative phosphoribosyl transferase
MTRVPSPPHSAAFIDPPGLEAYLGLPRFPRGLVVFVHGSGSSRHSPRNVHVADALQRQGFATLLFDLLTPDEGELRRNVFDIELLGARVLDALRWVANDPRTQDLGVGLFGASTGAAAALVAAARAPAQVRAVVSRGGRPDLAGNALARVTAPTLLVVGGLDHGVLGLNREALQQLRCEKALAVVEGATHLFEEPGTLDQVIGLVLAWFERHLAPATPAS